MATTRPRGRPLDHAVRRAQEALAQVDPDHPADALPLLREAAEQVGGAIDEAMAATILEEGRSIRSAGALAGLSENAVGPRLARTQDLAAYVADSGRVTARGVERALYDKERGEHRTPEDAVPRTPMRFKPRRSSS